MADGPDAARAQLVAQVLPTLLRILKEQQKALTQATLVSSAIVRTLEAESYHVHGAFLRHLEQERRESLAPAASQRVIAELDRLAALLKATLA